MMSFHILTKLKAVIRTLFFACMISNFFYETGFAIDEFSELKTVAEKSEFTATSKHSEVIDFQNQLAKMSSIVSNREIGRTVNGRSMQATIIAEPAYQFGSSTESRLVVLMLGNIHSGECAGKEGLLMLLRDVASTKDHPWLKDVVLVCLPNYNADGNDRIGRNEMHRPGQIGPSAGMGLRENAQQLDLNRDFIKIESPEARSLVKLIDDINPDLFIDCHTTNGSRHRYQLTYDIPHNPTAPKALRDFLRNKMMPDVTKELEDEKKVSTFYYGNFNRDQTSWTTYGFEPRYSTEYVGLRGRLSILSEAYSYISYKDRIFATKDFVTSCVDYVQQNKAAVKQLLARIEGDSKNQTGDSVSLSLEAEIRPFKEKFVLKGYDGASQKPKDYTVDFIGDYVATKSKPIPFGYVLTKEHGRIADRLLMHGISVHCFTKSQTVDTEIFIVGNMKRASREFQKHKMVSLEGKWSETKIKVEAGDYFIPTAQPLGRLAAYMLEPESNDGLVTWNFFDAAVEVDDAFPVGVLPAKTDLGVKSIAQVTSAATLDLTKLYGDKGKVNFDGSSPSLLKWISDTTYKTTWGGREIVVDVETGNLERVPTLATRVASIRLSDALEIEVADAQRIVSSDKIDLDDAVIFNNGVDLFWVSKVEDTAKQLTSDSIGEELVVVSPDKTQIAFVKANDLYRCELKSGTINRVTTGASENILNGKLDWVYQEELYGRGNFKGFWWSPDSKSLAYLTLNQTEVKRFQVTDNIPVRQSHEVYPYPKAGDPNPTVAISIDGKTLDLAPFGISEPLISQVCWSPKGELYFQLQNRVQNEMRLVSWNPKTSTAKVVVSQSETKGWIESPGNPIWIEGGEGNFVWYTLRSGRRQIATYSDAGELVDGKDGFTQSKSDGIEVRSLLGVTKDGAFFTAAPANDATRIQLFRLGPNGKVTLLTDAMNDHRVKANGALSYFFDFESNISMPTKTALRRMDGSLVRYVDPNLVDELDYYNVVQPKFQRVPTRDGDQLDSMLILPPDFDESKKYPVLVHVYSGPQAPRVRNRWGGTSYLWHQMLAQKGFVVWMCDNRSASYRGLDKAYPIYRDLGRRELEDIEDGLTWLKKKSWVDDSRIGIWGWSYGGYMTAYAMTHSKSFKIGISGAPVTDWRNYDSIYTERYMGLPSDNQLGYDESSVVKAAKNLHGKLLLIHGTQDDNVHISNSFQFMNALQNAGKHFDLMIYPKNRHGIRVPEQMRHLRKLMADFVIENL